jgi:hypothetical protein
VQEAGRGCSGLIVHLLRYYRDAGGRVTQAKRMEPLFELDSGIWLGTRTEQADLELALVDLVDDRVDAFRQYGKKVRQKLRIVDVDAQGSSM